MTIILCVIVVAAWARCNPDKSGWDFWLHQTFWFGALAAQGIAMRFAITREPKAVILDARDIRRK